MKIDEISNVCGFEIPKHQKRIRLRKSIQIIIPLQFRNGLSKSTTHYQPSWIFLAKFQQNHTCLHEISHVIVGTSTN